MENEVNINNIRRFNSSDLALSGFLATRFNLLEAKRVDGNRFEFSFESSIELLKTVSDYFTNHATVNPAEYFQKIKLLKSQIYSERIY
jgi:hypothetical protein